MRGCNASWWTCRSATSCSALVHVHKIEASGIDVALSEPTKPPEPKPPKPFTLKPPIDVAIDSLVVDSARVRRDDTQLVELTRAVFDGHWTSRELAVKRLDVRSPQGEIEFAGRVGQRGIYSGEGRGRFRWKAGERLYAGVLETYTQGDDANAVLKMSAPLDHGTAGAGHAEADVALALHARSAALRSARRSCCPTLRSRASPPR